MRRLLETPERVAVAFEVAGIGPRALAFLVDVGILLAFWILVLFLLPFFTGGDARGWLEGLSTFLQTLLVIAIFVVNWGYALLFEWALAGQTPGKRLLGLRVIRTDGKPYDLVTSAVRNLTRLVDGFPMPTYAVGLVCAVVTREHRRVGDLLAGTLLVVDREVDLSQYDPVPEGEAEPREGLGPARAALSAEAFEMVTSFLARAPNLEPEARARVARATLEAVGPALDADARAALDADPGSAEARLRELVETTRAGRARGAGGEAEALVAFVHARRPAWEKLSERLDALAHGHASLDALGEIDRSYRRLTADLAHAQTFFPRSVPTLYLNRLAARAYREIYRGAGGRAEAFAAFWREGFPGAVWRARPQIALSAGLLVLGIAMGALLTLADPRVADTVLGERIMRTVRSGGLWTDGVLAVAPPSVLGARIFTNNVSVTFAAFVGGLTAGVLTAALLVFNGGLLGVAFVATAQHGVALRLLAFIAAHGPVELSVIVLAGAAGLLVGGALVSPGELSRADALAVRGREAVRIALGGVPWLVLVGLVEAFVSPGTLFPGWAKASFGLVLGVTLWAYVVRFGRRSQAARARI